jgi:predicted dehydrogenase
MTQDRRGFLKEAGFGAAALSLGSTAASAQADKVVFALVGVGGMGGNHLRYLLKRQDAEIAYVCDVDKQRLAKAAAEAQAGGHPGKPIEDMRKALEDKRVDAVLIATPDHWHTPAAILAMDAGKHVYVEKPCCHNLHEGRMLVEAMKRTGKRCQVGTQSRSTDCVREAVERLHKGEIGEVLAVKAWNSQRRGTIGKTQPSEPPPHLDYDTWIGPATMVPYRSNMLPGIWRWWHHFGAGDIGNDGVHDIDVALWGLGVETHPSRITCLGGKSFFDDDQEWPDTQYAVFEYPGGPGGKTRTFTYEQRIWSPYVQEGYENGSAWYGTNGLLVMGHNDGWKLYGPQNKLLAERVGKADLAAHHSNFIDCVKDPSKKLNADASVGHLSAGLVHLANIALRTGKVLHFDPEKEEFVNDAEANALLRRKYRKHWGTPKSA